MEYGWNFSISGLKMKMKSGVGKIFLKFLHAGDYFHLLHKSAENHKFSNIFPRMERFQKKILDHFPPSFLGQNFLILGKDYILRVKTMYESVKWDVLKEFSNAFLIPTFHTIRLNNNQKNDCTFTKDCSNLL